MAPFISRASSKVDRGEEELLAELEILNEALQSRRHTRSRSLASYNASPLRSSELKRPSKRHIQPKPSFKVPFRSASVSCDRSLRLQSSSLEKQIEQQDCSRKGHVTYHSYREQEEHLQNRKEEILHYFRLQYGVSYKKSDPAISNKKGPSGFYQKRCTQCDQVHERKGVWHWKPLRAISHIILNSHHRLNVLFRLEVQCIERLPKSLNEFNLAVVWICKDHCLQTKPSKIVDGIAVFGETLQHECRIYNTQSKSISVYDAKPCILSIVVPDMNRMEISRHHLDLSSLLPWETASSSSWQKKSHDVKYELMGLAEGAQLIATFHYHLVQKSSQKNSENLQSLTKKRIHLRKLSFRLSKHRPLFESGATMEPCQEYFDPSQRHTLLDSFMKEGICEAADLLNDSFEFKPPLNQFTKDNQGTDCSSSPAHFTRVTCDSQKNTAASHEENLPLNLTSNHASHTHYTCEKDGMEQMKEPVNRRQVSDSGNSSSILMIPSFISEEPTCIKQTTTVSDDDLDSVAEEFLNMLGIGFDSGHHNSEDDLESPREGLLKQFEDENIFATAS
ncbi:hypothetical protein KP509_11G029800 [Ceratopteris richardii]|uniref:C2 NT-type domain-containing protein n=1 Tax=Ceratopteris richardii TaxID=49495 RepID=A0A8T2TT41_CERRI|nr:hypothetical protein KP509_11G029800 [Ceratopteris richardii]